MRVWKLLIRPHGDAPDLGQGWALAETLGEALRLAGHPEAMAILTETTWPGAPGELVFWSSGPLAGGW